VVGVMVRDRFDWTAGSVERNEIPATAAVLGPSPPGKEGRTEGRKKGRKR
jgi:hypothetical protein